MGKTFGLKSVLRNFLNHFETMENRRKTSDDDLYQREFQSLKELTETLKSDPNYLSHEGLMDVNRRKNRYKDILPYDYSRVTVSEYPGVPGSDYINANYVRGSSGSSCAYIASQGPLPNTVVDFWRMIWECEVTLIVMACNERESGKYKCDTYWPLEDEEERQYGNITVELVKWRQVCPDFLVRTLRVRAESIERIVCQFHYTTWPDHGVPTAVQPIIELVRLMRDVQASEARPILVHCSAGCGRTGTICSIDYVWALLRAGKLSEDFSLFSIISDMRRQRIAMVQTQEQYMLCYKAVAALFEQQLKMIDAHTYENLDEDGEPLLKGGEDGARGSSTGGSVDSFPDERISGTPAELLRNNNWKEKQEEKGTQLKGQQEAASKYPAKKLSSHGIVSKHDKIIGKATVIRHPSIAKLKAMFENIQTNDQVTTERVRRSNGTILQRSHSTRERSARPLPSVPSSIRTSLTTSNLHAAASGIDEEQPIYGFSYIPQFDDNEPRSSGRDPESVQISQSDSQPSQFQHNVNDVGSNSESQDVPHFNNSQISGQKMVEQHSYQRNAHPVTALNVEFYNHSKPGERQLSFQYLNSEQGPPKPPRTYQYLESPEEDNGACSSSGGRLITVSVALHKPCEENRVYQRHHNASAPNLANIPIANYYRTPAFGNNRHSGCDPVTVHPKLRPPNSMQRMDGNHISEEPIYQAASGRALPPQAIYEPLRRDLSVPLLAPSSLGNGHPKMMSLSKLPLQEPLAVHVMRPLPPGEGIYEITQKRVLPHGYMRPSKLPVTYVKPQQRDPDEPVKATVKPVNDILSVKPCPVNNVQPKSKETKKSNAKGAKSSLPSKGKEGKKPSTSFTSLFGFGRKGRPKPKPTKVASTPGQASVPPANGNVSTNQTNGLIRPPHSHRFSPPTQWTQV